MGGSLKELGAANAVHQRVQESVKVTGGGIGEQVDALSLGGFAQGPHLVPGGGNLPALFLKQAGVVEQAAGAVEHGGHVGLAIVIGVGQRGIGKAASDLIFHKLILAGHGHAEHVGDFGHVIVLDELLGQSSGTAGGQMDHIGELAALHGGANNVLQVLVGDKVNGDAGLGREGLGNLRPDFRAISRFNSSDLNGFGGHGRRAQAQSQNQRQRDTKKLFHRIIFPFLY